MSAKRTILIVDDDPKVRKTLSDVLRVRGYAPTAAATGKAALDRIEEESPAVALIDLKLEDISGLELMRKIKECCPATECIVLTGYATQKSAIEAVNLGAYSYVQKPYDVEQLLVAVRRAVEKRAAEEALRESEEKYRTILENIEDGYYEVDIAGNFTFFNDSLCTLLGYSEDELMGMNNRQYMDDVNAKALYRTFNEVYRTGKPAKAFDWEVIRKDGTRRFVESSLSLIRGSTGEPVGFRGIVCDISERKQAEEEIRQRTAQLEALRQVGLKLTAELDLDSLLNSIVSQAIELLGGTAGGLDLYQPERDVLEWTASVGPNSAPSSTVIRRGEGLAGKVWETGEPLVVDDYQHWEGRAVVWEGYPFEGIMGVPVRWGDEFLGVLEVTAEPPRTFSPADAEVLGLFATQAAIAIRNARLYEETRSRAERLAVVNRIARAVGAILDLDDLLETVYQEITSVFQADAFFVALYDEGANELDFRIQVDEGIREPPGRQALEVGLISRVIAARKPLLIQDLEQERDRLPPPDLWGTMKLSASWLGAPMLIGQQLIGVICVQSYSLHAYGEAEELLLSTIADQVAVAIEQARLYETEREQRELAEALEAAAAAVSSTLEPDQVLDRILEQVERVVAGDAFNVMLIEDDSVRVTRSRGYEHLGVEEQIARFTIPVADYPGLAKMAQTGEPSVIPDTATDPDWMATESWEWLRSYVGAPIRVGGVTVGILNVDGTRPGQFGPADAQRLEAFADHAAAAIENARLFEQSQQEIAVRKRAEEELRHALEKLRKTLGATIQAMSVTVETKDPYTAGHQRRVANLARAIATEMGLSQEQIEGIRMAGGIHDIGKIAIPAEVLSTPNRLNGFQWGMIKTHPKVGYDILKEIEFPWPVAQIVLQHHERLDGSGYPQGLSGEEILLEARVLAVADVVEAMASHRPYRPTCGIDKALEEISQNRGVLYDAEAVDACLKLFTEKGFEFE